MDLKIRSTSLGVPEDDTWLASRHGTDATDTIHLDGAAMIAIYTDGLIKSGTVLAKNTSTGRYVPYDQATSANGLNVAAGHLYRTIQLTVGDPTNSAAALLWHGEVRKSRLPRTTSQTGGLHADAEAASKFIRYV